MLAISSDSHKYSFDPDRPDFKPYGLTCVNWQPSAMPRPDHHNEVEFNLLKSGSVTYLLGGQKVKIEQGKMSVFWAAIPHQIIDYAPNTSYIVATVPLQNFLEWRLPDEFVQRLMQGNLISETNNMRASEDAFLFDRWEADLQQGSPELEKPVLLEMQARITRLALNCSSFADGDCLASVRGASLNKVEQMACFIAQNYTQKITVKQVSEHVKLHSNYAMSLFQKTFGMTLINYLTLHRVSHSQRLLTTTNQTITEIAYKSGFQSISRFNDAFCRACNCSPREYRKLYEISDLVTLSKSGPTPKYKALTV